jgi:hypothetical protein
VPKMQAFGRRRNLCKPQNQLGITRRLLTRNDLSNSE